jgi:hypothetical protein
MKTPFLKLFSKKYIKSINNKKNSKCNVGKLCGLII